jgi:hypothetical protein
MVKKMILLLSIVWLDDHNIEQRGLLSKGQHPIAHILHRIGIFLRGIQADFQDPQALRVLV